jgi:hypothetical protein
MQKTCSSIQNETTKTYLTQTFRLCLGHNDDNQVAESHSPKPGGKIIKHFFFITDAPGK